MSKMKFTFEDIAEVAEKLEAELKSAKDPAQVAKSSLIRDLYAKIKTVDEGDRAKFGAEVNELKNFIQEQIVESQNQENLQPIDVTAPMDVNSKPPTLLSVEQGSSHPLSNELQIVVDIFVRMGFTAIESRQLDDEYHMFTSLNFPDNHPARDDYDTFMTDEGLIAPAHTSTMQNRVIKQHLDKLDKGLPIQVVIPGRVFRNEDVDARHEHTFNQVEGVYVGENVTIGNLVATLKTFLEEYYKTELKVKIQPYYFPFTEPSFEFTLSCPFCAMQGCQVCSYEGWIELLGCGLIHPNVLQQAGVDTNKYTGFAWGFGLDRLVMMKYNIEDVRLFQSGRLDFLSQFKRSQI
jgi:phenylalanyl-tRNA synthetase alpha chain